MFEKCPQCGRMHIFKPKVCGCGYDSEKGEERQKVVCPRDGTELKLEWFDCPKCKTPLNDLFRYACPKCGEMVGIKDAYCKCGNQLLFKVFTCPFCKKDIDAKSIACPRCGKNLYLAEHDYIPEEHMPTGYVPEEYHCPRCGYRLPTAASDCPVCTQPRYYYDEWGG